MTRTERRTERQRVAAMRTFLFLTACGIAFLIGQHAGSSDRHELVTPTVTVTTPAWADGCTTDADCAAMERSLNAAGLVLVGGGEVAYAPDTYPVTEGMHPEQNCLTNGDGCDSTWQPVTQELADALAEGDDTEPAHADTRKWEECLLQIGDTSTIVCPDGYVTTS